MIIKVDPDNDTEDNLKLIVKIIEAKLADRPRYKNLYEGNTKNY